MRQRVDATERQAAGLLASHAHFDHIGNRHEFEERWIAEAEILVDPRPKWRLARRLCRRDHVDRPPKGWNTDAYRVTPVPATKLLADGDMIGLGNRSLIVRQRGSDFLCLAPTLD